MMCDRCHKQTPITFDVFRAPAHRGRRGFARPKLNYCPPCRDTLPSRQQPMRPNLPGFEVRVPEQFR